MTDDLAWASSQARAPIEALGGVGGMRDHLAGSDAAVQEAVVAADGPAVLSEALE